MDGIFLPPFCLVITSVSDSVYLFIVGYSGIWSLEYEHFFPFFFPIFQY